jgi:hypothetical protein
MKIDTVIKLSIIVILFLLMLRIFLFFSNQIQQERLKIFEREEIVNSIIGEDIVLGTDTLTVIKYYQDSDMYRLSNDQVVSSQVIKKRLIK